MQSLVSISSPKIDSVFNMRLACMIISYSGFAIIDNQELTPTSHIYTKTYFPSDFIDYCGGPLTFVESRLIVWFVLVYIYI